MLGEAISRLDTPRGALPGAGQVNAQVSVRLQDIVLVYRSENLFGSDFRTSAYDIDTGFAPTTTRNVTLALSWILVD